MGPSLLLSSVVSMAAEWNRTSINSTFNNSSSSNDDEEDDDGQTQQHHVLSSQNQTERGTESFPPDEASQSALSFTFLSQPELDSELQREQAATYSFSTRASKQLDNTVPTTTTIASTQRNPSFLRLDFSTSPLYSSTNASQYLPVMDGMPESSTNAMEEKYEEDDVDDRKPAALASPRRDDDQTSTYPVTAQNEIVSPHRKSHSISSDPFHSSSAQSNVEERVLATSNERFIDPTFSFGEEYEAREFDEAQSIIPHVWESLEPHDPKFNVLRRRHFTPPHADFAAPYRPPYAMAAPNAIAFRIGDNNPDFDTIPSTDEIQEVIGSVIAETKTRKMISNRTPLPITMHQSIRPPARGLVFRRREASAHEIESADTDRARSAIHVWYKRFNELIDYCEIHGDCNVPQKYAPNAQLGIWVNKQRMEKKFLDENKRTSMTASKVEALESIGFTWAKRKGDASWLYKYHELQKFLEQFGSCDVPTKYAPNPALGRWVSTQRSEYKIFMQTDGRSRHLTQEKIDMLNAIGFKWEMIPSRLSNSSSHSNGTSSSSSHNTNTSRHATCTRSREV